ncbi:TetR/AcrR family transcriptional regulator [Variovorax sp. NFACC27]|uniref:TetR/AcrR family transcriptional regulator n=1 Tax=unclassified Variovorax TaxID=663243 RepID=UPI00089DA20F|nr:transcriptional regulator, TetR family [Variovorax sp. NFACC28]SEG34616.1 transcriptional regulator, TetR family [Variovorax sp. NFACC29]SFC36870.1 transcriptional regulator, TetR family [Variovorax sp. NFACC26]SFF88703.1 transcriptional regulator, TetR family [Variovorax sp. NFACC27]
MRVKTEAKRDAIVQVASEVFRELGFEGASMVEIAARVGGSRATLYGYFASKEELFVAVIHNAAKHHFEPIFAALAQEGDDDLELVLQRFGEKVLVAVCSQEVIQAHRAVIAESGRTDIGRLFYEGGPKKGVAELAGFLERQMHKGRLRTADTHIAAQHLMALLHSETVTPSLLGIQGPMTRKDLREATRRALQVFLGGYAPVEKTSR